MEEPCGTIFSSYSLSLYSSSGRPISSESEMSVLSLPALPRDRDIRVVALAQLQPGPHCQ